MEPSHRPAAPQSFAPGWSDAALLEQTLVGRKDLVDRLQELAIDGAGGPNKHQRLIVGPRGSGKTHVLRVLHNRLWDNEELKKRLLIVFLLEDELGVATFLDFVVRLLRAIQRWYPEHGQLGRDLEVLYDLPAAVREERAVSLLLDAAGGKDVLIITENLGLTFDKTRGFGHEGQQALRNLFQQQPIFMVFASSQALVEGTRDPDGPFYGFFKTIHLRRLTLDEALTFVQSIASATGNEPVQKLLDGPTGRGRMRAIFDFTGGNHRLLVSFYEFLACDSMARLSEQFLRALNPLRPYYQEQMRSLSAQQQKIVQYLSLQRRPRTVKDIARGCMASQNTISKQLKELLDRGHVARIEQGRESYYEIAEALFRICYEADIEQEGAPVRLFVDFLANLYTLEELEQRLKTFTLLASEFGNEGAVPFASPRGAPLPAGRWFDDEARIYELALAQARSRGASSDIETRSHLATEIDPHDVAALASLGVQQGNAGQHQEALELFRQVNRASPEDAEGWRNTGDALQNLGRQGEAEDAYRRALELDPENAGTLFGLGVLLGNAGRHREALDRSRQLTRVAPNLATGWTVKGEALRHLEMTSEAEAAYREALALDSESPALYGLGILLRNEGRYDEALALLERFNNASPGHPDGWRLTGDLLRVLGRPLEEAEVAYRRTLELEPKSTLALFGLGACAAETGRLEQALERFEQLNRLVPDDADGWMGRGEALQRLGRFEEAEVSFRRALELDPENAALYGLGTLAARAGRHREALDLFQRFNKATPDNADGWRRKGEVLRILGHSGEAEDAFRRALELDPRNAALKSLGMLLGQQDRHVDALELFQRYNQVAPADSDGWTLTGTALHGLERFGAAEAAFRKALQLDSDSRPLKALGAVLARVGRLHEALNLLQGFNTTTPDDATGWRLTGLVLQLLGDHQEAADAYQKAVASEESDPQAWEGLGSCLEALGEEAEAERAFHRAEALGLGKARLLNARGEARRGREDYRRALADYEAALEEDPRFALAHFNAVSALLGLGRIEDALGRLSVALEAEAEDRLEHEVIVESFRESCIELFRRASPGSFSAYLEPAMVMIERAGHLERFEQSLPKTVFSVLGDHATMDEDRLQRIVEVFDSVLAPWLEVATSVRFLQVGIAHFKQRDTKALLALAREERSAFCEMLGIEDPGAAF
jgi:tetratricopeptide (TPR) repeat protein